jgi:nucleoside-diphosphate-sugar epimerase
MHKIIITGASGFLGKNLVQHLSEFKIISFSRTFGLDYKLLTYDYLNNNQIDIVIHLAGIAHDIKKITNEEEYYKINTDLTKKIFDSFLNSNAKVFIYLSSVKAAKDFLDGILNEEVEPTPNSVYGKSKLAAEKYLLSKSFYYKNKRVYILRPCMVHGPDNKGNLNTLYKYVSKRYPWPLGAFNNKRSLCSIDNFNFVVRELLNREDINSGIYNLADDIPLSTNEIVSLISISYKIHPNILNINKRFIKILFKIGDLLRSQYNSEILYKLTENYVIDNNKIKKAIGKDLPINSTDGLLKTFSLFK